MIQSKVAHKIHRATSLEINVARLPKSRQIKMMAPALGISPKPTR